MRLPRTYNGVLERDERTNKDMTFPAVSSPLCVRLPLGFFGLQSDGTVEYGSYMYINSCKRSSNHLATNYFPECCSASLSEARTHWRTLNVTTDGPTPTPFNRPNIGTKQFVGQNKHVQLTDNHEGSSQRDKNKEW